MHLVSVVMLLLGLLAPIGEVLAHAGHGAPDGHVHPVPVVVIAALLLVAATGRIILRGVRSKGPDPAG